MIHALDEPALAASLCADLLTAAELKTLCETRGFPLAGVGKGALAQAASARFLEPVGVINAMASLEPRWLKVLHLVAVAGGPLSLRTLARAVERGHHPYASVDPRAFWREVTAGLLSRGVALAVEQPVASGGTSRFERFSVALPRAFASSLPPFPIETAAVEGHGDHGDLDQVFARALDVLVGAKPHAGTDSLATQLSAQLTIKNGTLSLHGVDRPEAEHLARLARTLLQMNLKAAKGDAVAPGSMALQILGSLTSGTACSAEALADALSDLGFETKLRPLEEFLKEAAGAGFLVRFDRSRKGPLFRAAPASPAPTRDALRLAASPAGARVVLEESGVVPLLQAAAVARVSVVDGALVLEPDPVLLGRTWHDLSPSLRASLTEGSRAFHDVAKLVERRAGQVLVHRGLALLRIEDAGLFALLSQRFADAVRPIDARYLACFAGRLDEVLALARREGYVARRSP